VISIFQVNIQVHISLFQVWFDWFEGHTLLSLLIVQLGVILLMSCVGKLPKIQVSDILELPIEKLMGEAGAIKQDP
jgi:hypothetical protein